MTTPEPLDASNRPLTAVPAAEFDKSDTDGRSLRRRRNRDAVIESLISLIREGRPSPTVAEIADRAGVSHRSIFRYFDDLNDLARTAIETEFRKSVSLATIADPGTGTLDDRIDEIISRQLAVLRQTHLLGRVARGRMIDIPEIDRGMANITELRLDQLRKQFAPELDAMDDDRSEAILIALAMTAGFDSYDLQVRNLELDDDEIARNWRTVLHALLD